MRLELEEATTPQGHTVRFGFNPLEFESFSWRGYAQMTPIQVGKGPRLPDGGCGFPLVGGEERGPWGQGTGHPDSPWPPPAQDRGKAERDLP